MHPTEMDAVLRSMLDDQHLTRSERRGLRVLVQEQGLSNERLAVFRSRAFELARARAPGETAVFDWLEDAIKALLPGTRPSVTADARFSPGAGCRQAIVNRLQQSQRQVDVCVFTITDDEIVRAMFDAHRRGVKLRVITDDDKSHDLGSDVDKLARAGISVRMDTSPSHMHHKFAIFDQRHLLTGSYNWTRSAAERNQENLVITAEAGLVQAFVKTFSRLWREFAD